MMHFCLTIVEVQHAIFREVQAKPRGSTCLASLARTCRTFNSTALDILWETLPSIRYLIRCLPTDLWKISRAQNNTEINFQRAMTNSDWETFFRFSSRIRSLYSAIDTRNMACPFFSPIAGPLSLHIDAIIALSRPPNNGPAIPNLKTLHWSDSDIKYAPLLQSLLVCSLVDVSLPSFALQSPEMPMDLIIKCVSLKSLSVLDNGQGILSETFMHLRSLESLCLTLSEATICSLSNLPALVKLLGCLQNNLQPEKVKCYLTLPAFPSLKSLSLHLGENALSILTSLLDGMRFSPREVSFLLFIPPTPDMLYIFFSTLVNACGSERLSHISLITIWDEYEQDEYPPEISLVTFEPLLALPNVESFTLDVPYDICLDDSAIDTLTKHWPKLTQLSLNSVFGWGIESGVTHQGLITLLTRCRSLTEFTLSVDFSEVDLPLDDIPRLQLANKVSSDCRRAYFVSSTIENPASIAAFLRDICPRLSYVTSFCPDDEHELHCDMGEECDLMRWERVNEIFLTLTKDLA